MWVFEAEQHAYDIGGVMVGGQPGEYPTALCASIFYMGDKLILNEVAGEFDQDKAYEVVQAMRDTCAKAGVPLIIDMIGGSTAAMANYVEWIAPTGLPCFIDGTTPAVRMAGARKAVEPGPCSKTIWLLKDKYGYPAGCSPTHMVMDRWAFGSKKFDKLGYTCTKTSLATSTIMMGADYFMYGIKQLEIVPSMAMVDSVIAYTQRQQKIRSTLKVTPLSQLMKQE